MMELEARAGLIAPKDEITAFASLANALLFIAGGWPIIWALAPVVRAFCGPGERTAFPV